MKVLLYDSIICRLCAAENQNGVILHVNDGSGDNLCSMINQYLPIKIQDDGKLPRTICPGCNIQVHATVQFFDLLVEGQKKLRELWRDEVNSLKKQQKQQCAIKPKDFQNPGDAPNEVDVNVEEDVGVISHADKLQAEMDSTIDNELPVEDIEKQLNQENSNPVYTEDHSLSLKVEGLERPRRKRGRPRKLPFQSYSNTDTECDHEDDHLSEYVDNPKSPASDDGNEMDADGRKRRRKRKVPVRFREAVQGKELERIFIEEGVIDEEDEKEVEEVINDDQLNAVVDTEQEIIGHMETQDGVNLGELIVVNRLRKSRNRFLRRKKAKFHCEVCGKTFLHQGRYLLHKSFHMGIKFECFECKKRFTTKDNFDLHQKMMGHSGEGIVKEESGNDANKEEIATKLSCPICEKTFTSKQSYEIHLKAVHEGQKPFVCAICNKEFGYQNSLKCHIMTYHDVNSTKCFPCDICGKRLNHPSSVIYHKEAEHNNGRRFVCDTCGKGFKHKQLLQRHQLVHSDDRPYQCITCNASFKSKANLMNHQSTHTGEKKHYCEVCGQQFAHKTSLTLHYRWHSGQKPYECEICNKRFSQKGNLHEHIRIHTGEKPFSCDYCERKFTTSSQYKLHLKRHTGERPWKCDYCSKAFLHKDTWKCHMRRHKGEKPFQCSYCSREFPEQWALKKHLRLHTGERPYACDICGKTFADCSNLTKHKKVHDRGMKVESVNKSEGDAGVSQGLGVLTSAASESAATENVGESTANDMNVWNIIRDYNGAQTTDDVHQIIYVTYQDPDDPDAKISEKCIIPESHMLASDGANIALTTNVGGKSLQVTDENGQPIHFTMQDGSELQITTSDGENLQVTMKDGQTIPIHIATGDDEEEVPGGEEQEAVASMSESSTRDVTPNNKEDEKPVVAYQLTLPNVITDEEGELHEIDENIQTYEFLTEDGTKVRLTPFAVAPINTITPDFLNVS